MSINELKQLHRDGKLCVFVGAGVSKSCNLPDWNTLSARVIKETWPDKAKADLPRIIERSVRSKYSPLDAMRMARRELGQQFNSVVFRCLYSEAVNLSPTVESIVSLSNVRRICCSNYDDILEEGYTNLGIKCRPLVRGDDLPFDSDEVLICHPHGFLPRTRYSRDYLREPIVLSEDDYHELYATPYSWANVIQLNLFISFNMLFVGCSLKDPNLRRLLDISKKVRTPSHFALMEEPTDQSDGRKNQPQWWKYFKSSFPREIETENLTERGVTPIWYKEDSDVSTILREIA
jgi:hypothetical protein